MLALLFTIGFISIALVIWAMIEGSAFSLYKGKNHKNLRSFLWGACVVGAIWWVWSLHNPRAIDYLRGNVITKITYEQIGDSISTPIDTTFVWGGEIKVYPLEETE